MPQVEVYAPLIDRAIVVTGPTAAGKSRVAIELAARLDGELISLDSIAVYQGMDIGTAKPSPDDRRRVPHHLLDVVPPTDEYSVARYVRAAREVVDAIESRGRRPIFVGGTPLFLKAVLRGFDPGPPADWKFREAVEDDIERHGLPALRARLQQVDPLAAHRIGPSDKRRMIRALEVARYCGQPMSHRQIQFDLTRSPSECLAFSIGQPRDVLHQRINQRVDRMFATGLVDEVRGLLARYHELSRTARQAVGYREVIAWLDDGGDLEPIRQAVAAHTRQLARRQETWFRSLGELRPVTARPGQPASELVDQIATQIDCFAHQRRAD